MQFHSITVSPYMGKDSVEPFLEFKNKFTLLLALTSNTGAFDFQTLETAQKPIFQQVLETSKTWKNSENLMYVIGATKAKFLQEIRKIVPNSFLLIPGVGAQGGNLQDVCKYGLNAQYGLLINASRSIIYASSGEDFATNAALEAQKMQLEMEQVIHQSKIKIL